jgi:hypothetical protein
VYTKYKHVYRCSIISFPPGSFREKNVVYFEIMMNKSAIDDDDTDYDDDNDASLYTNESIK